MNVRNPLPLRWNSRWIAAAFLILILLSIYVPPANRLIYENPLLDGIDNQAVSQVETSFIRALSVFAAARTANGIISVIQDSEVTVSPAGVGMTLALGEILDPANDLIERFSWVMLASLTALGLQKFLLEIFPWISIQVLLGASAAILLAGLWSGRRVRSFGMRLLVVAVVLRLGIPAVTLANTALYDLFLNSRYEEASAGLQESNRQLEGTEVLPMGGEEGFMEQLRSLYGSARNALELSRTLEALKATMSRYVQDILNLILVFLLNTVLIPVLTLWGLLKFLGWVTESALPQRLERVLRRRIAGRSGER